VLADVKSSAENLLNIGRTGLDALTGDTTAAAMAGAKREEEAAKSYTPGFQPQKIADKFNRGEYLGAAGEAISQVPSAIAGLLPSVGQEMGLAAAGRFGGGALGAVLPIPGGAALGATVGQYAVPLIVNAIQALGSQAQDKVQTQIEAGEKPDVNALELAPYAAANAAANLVGTRIAMPGIFKKAIGQKVAEETGDAARAALMAEATKTAGRGTMAAIGYGAGRFAVGELPTEIFQDVIDRAAIGKPLADDEAITQYRNTALNMAMASPLGGGFALKERSGARDVVAARQQEDAAQAATVQQQQEAVAAQQKLTEDADPAYAAKLRADYVAANVEMQRLNQAVKALSAEKDPLSVADAKDARVARDTYAKETMQPLVDEIRRVRQLHPGVDFRPPAAVAPVAPVAVAPGAPVAVAPGAPVAAAPGAPVAPAPVAPVAPVAPAPVAPAPVAPAPLTKAQAAEGTVSEPAPFVIPAAAAAPERMEEIQLHVDAIMGSPEIAAEMVINNEQIPGLTPEENGLFLEMLQQRLAQEELAGESAVPTGAEVAPAKKAKGKKAAAPAAPVVPAVEDTTVEPTEPRTLEQSLAAMDRTPEAVTSTRPINEIKAAINTARKEGRRDDARALIAELRVRTDKSQYMIPGAAPLKRTGAVQTKEQTQNIQTELKQLSKAYIAARQEGRRGDALEILDRMRYLKEQGKAAEVGPVLKGAADTGQSETIEIKPADRTSPRALQQGIERVRNLPSLTETQASLLDQIETNLPALRPYQGDVAEWLNSVRQGRAAPETEKYLRQQLAEIERQSQQKVSPRELQGMLVKISKPELSNKERGLLRLVGENQSTIMADPAARMAVARWLASDVGQGIGDATQNLRKYFGVAEETQAYESPVGKATAARAKDIEAEYDRAGSAVDALAVDIGAPLQPFADNIERMRVQLTRADSKVAVAQAAYNAPVKSKSVGQEVPAAMERARLVLKAGIDDARENYSGGEQKTRMDSAKKKYGETVAALQRQFAVTPAQSNVDAKSKQVAKTQLDAAEQARDALKTRIDSAKKKYNADLAKLREQTENAEKLQQARKRFADARTLRDLQDTVNSSDSSGARHDARNALNALMPLNVQAETKAAAPADADVAEMQADMFPAERKQAAAAAQVPAPAPAPDRTKERAQEQEAEKKRNKLTGDLSALPGVRISFDKRRAMLDAIDDAPVKRRAFEDAINDGNLSQEERAAAQADLTKYLDALRKKAADKDESYATAYKLRGEESALVQLHKQALENTSLSDAKKAQRTAWLNMAQDRLNERDIQLASLRGVEIEAVETPKERAQTLEQLTRETYGQAVSEEEQAQLDRTKGRAGAATVKAIQPMSVMRTGRPDQVGLLDKDKDTYTKPDMRVTEKREPKQRNVEISKEEQQEANAAAASQTMGPAKPASITYKKNQEQLLETLQQKVEKLKAEETAAETALKDYEERRATKAEIAAGATPLYSVDEAKDLGYELDDVRRKLSAAKEDIAQITDALTPGSNTETLLKEAQKSVRDLQAKVAASKNNIARVTDAIATGKQINGADGKPVDLKEISSRLNALLKQREKDLADAIKDVKFYRTELKEQTGDLVGKNVVVAGEAGKTTLSEEALAEVGMLRGTSGPNDTPLSGTNVDLLGSNNLAAVLTNISEKSNNAVARRIAGKLAAVIEANGVNVKVVEETTRDAPNAPGSISKDGNRIRINENTGLSEESVVHEAAHAATMFELDKPDSELTPDQRKAKAELTRMMGRVKADESFDNAVINDGDIHEFVAEGLASQAVQQYMRTKELEGRSLWQRFKDGVLRLIGVNTPARGPMLDRFLDLAEKFIAAKAANAPSVEKSKLRSVGSLLGPKEVKYANPGLAEAGAIGDKFVAKDRGAIDRVRAAAGGFLGLETQLVDRFAPLERVSKGMEALKGSQMMYYLRMYDQRMNYTAQSVANGAIQKVAKKRPDGRTEYVVESVDGANIKQVVDILKKAPAGSPDAANRLFTMYLAGIRAKNKGFDTLHFGTELTEAQLDSAMAKIRATPGLEENFKQAREVYNEYNRNMVGFLAQSGAISKEHAARLTKENDYVPFYREQNGVASLIIGGETPIRIGSIAEQPYLHELVGGDRPILDFLTSSVQNTMLITDMGLRNLATKNSMNELEDMGLAQIRQGPGTADPKTVRFKVDGADYHAIVDTDKAGVPADLLVKGMQGIPTQLPALVRAFGLPATILRRAVTLSPTYAARQLFRDSIAATLLSGADIAPVLGALKEVGKSATKSTLEKRGITGGQIFAGGSNSEAMTKILNDMLAGKGNIGLLIAKAEALNMEADAATRRAQYNSYIKQGLSEMEATLMSLESMNFNKRGASPSIHMANALIPFFNSQIQGLNVLYKALTGKLPFDKRLKIQEKLITRGTLMFGASLAYAAMMQDDEAYKNATPEQKYGNWFIRIPGIDEPIKFPIPFEVGYLFKALPEALYNSMANEHGAEEAFKALNTIILQTLPGGTSMATVQYKGINIPITPPIPQALKPAIEAALGKSFYTRQDILSRREQDLLPEQQFREGSSEISKMMGSGLGLSPIKIEALVSGYTGTTGLALMQVLSMGVPTGESPEKTTKRLSDRPVLGSSFQPNDAGGIINAVYERMNDVKKVKDTVDHMMSEGRVAEAKELVNKRADEFAQAGVADYFTSNMQQLTKFVNAIRASNLTGDEKREKLAQMQQMKIRLADMVRKATDEAKSID
jgi:hypothetical protein